MVIMDNEWNPKDELPTIRFWLMTKLRLSWDKRWEWYIRDLKLRLIKMMTLPAVPAGTKGQEAASKVKEKAANHLVEKLERSAWRTLPSEFLRQMEIPRVLHR